ncbi:sodium channel, voltage-gated, type I, beta a [Genypterus blacodes]|uniref:sodium channel, voltage-gated, type I, beta a n=1 Tax=Genypterus blacodes TaxID=154954 RepID=UPI003F75CF06
MSKALNLQSQSVQSSAPLLNLTPSPSLVLLLIAHCCPQGETHQRGLENLTARCGGETVHLSSLNRTPRTPERETAQDCKDKRTLTASLCQGACVEVDSDTEAVANEGFKLGCISCKMRAEAHAVATVAWYFKAWGEKDDSYVNIYNYGNLAGEILDDRFMDRLEWNGSKRTIDVQDGSIYILNVTFNDTGTYMCKFERTLLYPNYNYDTTTNKTIDMNVVKRLTRGMASILSEVMMYVTIIGLQFWLLVEMIYCYKKIAAAGEEALRENTAEYLAIASESKDNCAAVQVEE